MLLSGKLKPATVRVPLEAGLGLPPPPLLPHAAATKTSAAIAARNLPKPSFEFIEPFSLPPVCLPIQPHAWLDSSIYAVLKVVARRPTGARYGRILRGTSNSSKAESESSVAIGRAATSTAPAANFV